jgi:hypothetical protein
MPTLHRQRTSRRRTRSEEEAQELRNKPVLDNSVAPQQRADNDAQRKPVEAAHSGNGGEFCSCSGYTRAPDDARGRRKPMKRQHR